MSQSKTFMVKSRVESESEDGLYSGSAQSTRIHSDGKTTKVCRSKQTIDFDMKTGMLQVPVMEETCETVDMDMDQIRDTIMNMLNHFGEKQSKSKGSKPKRRSSKKKDEPKKKKRASSRKRRSSK